MLGLNQLAMIDDDAFDRLLEAYKKSTPALFTRSFLTEMADKVEGIKPSDVTAITSSVISLFAVLHDRHYDVTEFVEAVVIAPIEDGSTEPALDSKQQESLRTRLPLLFAFDETFGITTKANDVFTQHEHVFNNARILTDVRPIFTNDLTAKPNNVVVTHILKIGYVQDRELKEFFVAMDMADVKKLRDCISREMAKVEGLKKLFSKSGVNQLDTELEG